MIEMMLSTSHTAPRTCASLLAVSRNSSIRSARRYFINAKRSSTDSRLLASWSFCARRVCSALARRGSFSRIFIAYL